MLSQVIGEAIQRIVGDLETRGGRGHGVGHTNGLSFKKRVDAELRMCLGVASPGEQLRARFIGNRTASVWSKGQ